MDFEHAAQRLARDHSKLRDRRKERNKRGGLVLSEQAKRQAEEQRQRHARVRQARDTHKHNAQYRRQYVHACQRSLQETAVVAAAGSSSSIPVEAGATATHRMFTPTSIYGDGDKVTLPPSVLETLMQHSSSSGGSSGGTPWTFRIGILNPDYTVIPSSPLIQQLEAPHKEKEGEDYMDMDMDLDEEEEEEDAIAHKMQPYLDELSYKYLSYTHCTVVEFTQDEGCVGIPTRIAQALLDPNNQHRRHKQQDDTAKSTPATTSTSTIAATRTIVNIPTKRTIDPAVAAKKAGLSKQQHNNDEQDTKEETMQLDDTTTTATAAAANTINGQEDRETENSNNNNTTTEASDAAGMEGGTPGHVAWGTFDLPDTDLALTLVTLPKGTRCTLVPTPQAISQNFYALKDVKLVLEQSLIRTRATLSLGDVVTTWHRGVRYDLSVTAVFPATYQAVTCINTDIEVEIGTTAPAETAKATNSSSLVSSSASTGVVANNNDVHSKNEKGYRLGRATSTCSSGGDDNNNNNNNSSRNNKNTASNTHATTNNQELALPSLLLDLPPEPPLEQKEKVCTVQIRYQNCRGKRRFGLDTATVSELFAFAASVMLEKKNTHVYPNNFKLVTRFPRRELCLVDDGRSSSTKNENKNNDDIGTATNTTSNHNMVRASGALTLDQVGLKSGQELFMVEDL